MIYSTQRLEIISKCQKKTFLKSLFETRFKMSRGKKRWNRHSTTPAIWQFLCSPLVSCVHEKSACSSGRLHFQKKWDLPGANLLDLWVKCSSPWGWSLSQQVILNSNGNFWDVYWHRGASELLLWLPTQRIYVKKYIYWNYLIVSDLKVTHWKRWTSKASKPSHERLQLFAERAKEEIQ